MIFINMVKKLIISEEERKNILEQHSETSEGIFTPVKAAYQGLKGVWRGEGYDYYKYLTELGDLTQELKKLDNPNHKVMIKLNKLKNDITSSKMPQDKRDLLKDHIDKAISHFNTYERYVDAISRAVKTKLS